MNLPLFAQMVRTLIELRKENRGHFCVCLFLLLFFSGPAVLAQTKADLFLQALADPINAGNDATIEVQVAESGSFSATGPVYVVLNEIKYSGSISDGQATIVVSGITETTDLDVKYDGDENYNPASAQVTITVTDAWGIGCDGSETKPYVISSTEGLDLLSQKVNDGNSYAGKYFKIGSDITYTHLADGAEGAGEENNYTAIGNSDFAFQGHFDGGGKTISGIRIYNDDMGYQGLFGQIAAPGEVKNVILTDMRIVARENTGCVAGYNDAGTLKDNFVIGTTISSASDTYVGAIAGQNENGTLTGNYYAACTAGSTAKATGIGCNGADVTANDGALSVHQITFAEGVTGVAIDAAAKVYSYNSKDYYAQGKSVKLTYSGTPAAGYQFSGFTAGEGVTVTASDNAYTLTMPASDVTVDVVYQTIIYNITYNGVEDEGVTFTEDNPEAYTVANESFTLSNPSREGYLFTGWTYEGQTEPTKTVTIAKGSTGDKTFTANWKKLLTNTDITVSTIADQTYTGSETKPAITVKDGTTDITDQCDFTYNSNKVVGTAEVVISAKESSATYAGEKTVTFKIAPKTVSTPTITLSGTSFEYTGEAIKPTVTVKDGETTIPAEEYTVGYSNNIEAGTATVTITDNEGGNYTVSGTATFTITPKPNTAVVNVEETPVAIGGETYYGLTKEAQEIFKGDNASYVPSIGLSSEAIDRVELTEEGDLRFSKGTSTTMAMLNLKLGDIIKLFFRGIVRFNDDGSIFIVKSLTRGDGDTSSDGMIDLVSGAEYKVLKDGALVLTIVLENEEAVIEGISVTRAGTSTDEPTSIVVTAKNKYWTFSCDQDVKVPEGVKVYTCQLNSNGTKAIITELSATELGGVIKANNGVLLSSDPGDYTFVFSPETTSQAKTYENNALVAVVKPTHLSPNDYYVLKDNEFHVILDDDTEVPANKAVLKKPTGASGSRAIGIDEGDDATRIWGVGVADEDAVWYTISGQRIGKPTKKGLYIKNGNKVIIK